MAAPDELAGAVNPGHPQEVTVRELARHVIDLVNSRSRIAFRPLPPDDPSRRRPDIGGGASSAS
jgi:UDP-glucuronate decarboxylase